jgi:hypothetical protein
LVINNNEAPKKRKGRCSDCSCKKSITN